MEVTIQRLFYKNHRSRNKALKPTCDAARFGYQGGEAVFQTIDFRTPTVLFGMDSLNEIGKQAKGLGASRVLLITGPRIAKTGLGDRVVSLLKEEGVDVEVKIQGRDTPEPATEVPEEAARVAQEMKAEAIIGLGGGSILDVSKMAAALLTNPGKVRDYFGREKLPRRGIPTFMVPTTAGTGAEVTKHAIFLDRETNVKKAVASNALLPNVAIIDPMLTVTCPPSVTAASGFDAWLHAAEPFVSKRANAITDTLALEAIRMISRWLGPAYADGEDLEARYYMSLGCLMSGMVLNNSGTSLVHAMAYPVGGEYHTSHGSTLAALVLSCFSYITVAREEKFALMAEAMGEKIDGLSRREAAGKALDAIRHFLEGVNLPTSLPELGITDKSSVPQWAVDAHAEQRLLSRAVRKLSVDDLRLIYENAF